VGGVSVGMVLGMSSLAMDRSGVQNFVFVVISSFVVGLNVIGCGVVKIDCGVVCDVASVLWQWVGIVK